MCTNKPILKLPSELKDLRKRETAHHKNVTQNMQNQWRTYLVGELQDSLKGNHNFYEADAEVFAKSPLKSIICRFEFILN